MSTIRATFVQHGSSSVPNITLNASGQVIVASGIVSSGTFAAPSGTAAAPGVYFDGDTNTGLYSPGADQLAISTNGTKRIEIQADGDIDIDNGGVFYDATNNRLAIGTTPTDTLTVNGGIDIPANYTINLGSDQGGGATLNYNPNGNLDIAPRSGFSTVFLSTFGGSERARIDSSGRLLVGTSSARTNVFAASGLVPLLQIESTSGTNRLASITSSVAGQEGGLLALAKQRSGTIGGNTVVNSGDEFGQLAFLGSDGTSFFAGATIQAFVDGTPGANDMPGRLVFSVTQDGSASPTQRMVIKQNGILGVNVDSPTFNYGDAVGFQVNTSGDGLFMRSGAPCLYLNRKTSDGDLLVFAQDGANEGTISVSGTTVSYNGAHLSRWTQLPGGAERTEILRGTVLSNIDEMCEWGDEENEQLNRMKVSEIEGDKNVAGVFQAWDDDDDTYTNDFYCAMTGDFIIRIAQGVTVQRGDLLMSAGDGTAKPQDDDIIRSKTIAKVTSTNVTCTYEDGSYCVPCVLMAC